MCGELIVPMNGNIMYTNSIRENPISSGTIATYTCDATYSIVGASTRECNNSGQFNGSAPTCQRNSFDTLHVKLTLSVHSWYTIHSIYMHIIIVHYSALETYHHNMCALYTSTVKFTEVKSRYMLASNRPEILDSCLFWTIIIIHPN